MNPSTLKLLVGLVVFGVILASVVGCFHQLDTDGGVDLDRVMFLERQAPAEVPVGQTFDVTLRVNVKKSVLAITVHEDFGALSLVSQGTNFIDVNGTTLQGLVVSPNADSVTEFTYQLQCSSEGRFAITGSANSKEVQAEVLTSVVACVR